MWDAIISAGSRLLGGILGSDANQQALEQQRMMHAQNIALQKEFAQSGIQWRVADAKKAGVHPLAALGGGVTPFSPQSVSVGTDNSMASAVSGMGQDISRAVHATRTQDQRNEAFSRTVEEMQLQNMALRNELVAAQIGKLRSNQNPPMPHNTDVGQEQADPEKQKGLIIGGRRIHHDPSITGAQTYEDRYGEFVSDWIIGPYIAWRDFNYHQNADPKSGANMFRDRRKVWHGEMTQKEFEAIHGKGAR